MMMVVVVIMLLTTMVIVMTIVMMMMIMMVILDSRMHGRNRISLLQCVILVSTSFSNPYLFRMLYQSH